MRGLVLALALLGACGPDSHRCVDYETTLTVMTSVDPNSGRVSVRTAPVTRCVCWVENKPEVDPDARCVQR